MRTVAERLDRLKNYGTIYEVELSAPDGGRYCLGYTRRSRIAMIDRARERGQAIAAKFNLPVDARFGITGGKFPTLTIDGGYVIRFSGRTQRDAICSGELPTIR